MDSINTQDNTDTVEERSDIPQNSPTLLVDETSSRFSGAIWAGKIQEQNIVLAGLGGIGSYVGFLLSRVKPKSIYIYDTDVIDESNMSGQMYSIYDIGKRKVHALNRIMQNFSSYNRCCTMNTQYSAGGLKSNIMICGFDNMEARKTFYYSWKNYISGIKAKDRKEALFIDGRLAAEEFQVFCIKGDDEYHMKTYEETWLFDDSESEKTICSYKQTSHCANMIASIMVNLFVNFIANQCEPLIERDVPFMTSYDASTMYLRTIS